MAVRRFHVSLWPHVTTTTVTVCIEDTSGTKRVSGGVGQITLPVGRTDFTGEPVGVVLTTLGEALLALGSTLSPKGSPASPGGPQGRRGIQDPLPLDSA
jgi:hypothetical protein